MRRRLVALRPSTVSGSCTRAQLLSVERLSLRGSRVVHGDCKTEEYTSYTTVRLLGDVQFTGRVVVFVGGAVMRRMFLRLVALLRGVHDQPLFEHPFVGQDAVYRVVTSGGPAAPVRDELTVWHSKFNLVKAAKYYDRTRQEMGVVVEVYFVWDETGKQLDNIQQNATFATRSLFVHNGSLSHPLLQPLSNTTIDISVPRNVLPQSMVNTDVCSFTALHGHEYPDPIVEAHGTGSDCGPSSYTSILLQWVLNVVKRVT